MEKSRQLKDKEIQANFLNMTSSKPTKVGSFKLYKRDTIKMLNNQTVELNCGTKSFSKIASKRGYKTWTTDIDSQFNPDKKVTADKSS